MKEDNRGRGVLMKIRVEMLQIVYLQTHTHTFEFEVTQVHKYSREVVV